MPDVSLADRPPFVVTGATGYIASWVVWELLNRGAHVRATARDPKNTEKVGHLTRMADSLPGTLELRRADLLDASCFDAIVDGAGVVMHTASPVIIGKVKDPEGELIGPARRGTEHVLGAVNRAGSVERVIFTSSISAIFGDSSEIENAPNGIFTEALWNRSSTPTHHAYGFSKRVAEETAWELAKQQSRWSLVSINPGFVFGPSLTPRADSESIRLMRKYVDGSFRFGVPDTHMGFVDVRDVAVAHVEAALRNDAHGRYIVVGECTTLLDIGQMLRRRLGDGHPFPMKLLPTFLVYLGGALQGISFRQIRGNHGYRVAFDSSRSRTELGLNYRPLEDTVAEHAAQVLGT